MAYGEFFLNTENSILDILILASLLGFVTTKDENQDEYLEKIQLKSVAWVLILTSLFGLEAVAFSLYEDLGIIWTVFFQLSFYLVIYIVLKS